MRYYVVADPHGYYSALMEALEEGGFFKDEQPHKLIICGDLFDRGPEAVQLQQFVLISKQFLDLTLCNSANGGKACIYGLFRHLLYGRTIRI